MKITKNKDTMTYPVHINLVPRLNIKIYTVINYALTESLLSIFVINNTFIIFTF